MEILFTRSTKWGSRLIRRVTGEDVSHVAIRCRQFVIESRIISGVRIIPYQHFSQENEIVYRTRYKSRVQVGEIYRKYYSRAYDIGAFLYLGLRSILPILPKVNLWQTTGMYICTELVTDIIDNKEQSALTPGQLYHRLRGDQ